MKDLNNYIIEKLKINKNINIEDKDNADWWDARTFIKNEILFTNPNYSRGSKKPGVGGVPSFFRVLDNNGKKLTFEMLNTEFTEKDADGGKAIPNTQKSYGKITININSSGFAIYGGLVMYRWDGNPEKFYTKQ